MRVTTTAIRTAVAGLALLGLSAVADPASAAPYGAGVFSVGGGGISTVDDDGDVVVSGPALVSDRRLREMLDATLTVVVSPEGGELPAVGSCTAAEATFVVEGKRGVAMTLDGDGQVCARAITPTYALTVFEGVFDVVEAKRPDLRGTSGSYSVNITPNGFTSAYASSYLPA